MRILFRPFAALVIMALLLTACGSSSGSTWTEAPLRPTPATEPSAVPTEPAESPDGSATTARTIALELTSNLQIQQDGEQVIELQVKEGETLHFVLDNTSGFSHDFVIGPADALSAGTVDGLPGVEAWESGVRELDYVVTADTAQLQFACTVPGHYQTMHGSFALVS
jgi:azurin